jgi:hypothetical protein
MKLTPEARSKLMYHARMFALAVVLGITLFATLLGVLYVLLSLGLLHPTPDE